MFTFILKFDIIQLLLTILKHNDSNVSLNITNNSIRMEAHINEENSKKIFWI